MTTEKTTETTTEKTREPLPFIDNLDRDFKRLALDILEASGRRWEPAELYELTGALCIAASQWLKVRLAQPKPKDH